MNARPRFVIIANFGCRRLELFAAALEKLGFAPPIVVSYFDILTGQIQLENVVGEGDILRLESPGRDWQVEKLLLERGAEKTESEGQFRFLPSETVANLELEKGRLWPSRQWFWGLSWLLGELASQLGECPPHRKMQSPSEILVMFDKPACHDLLLKNGVAVAPALGIPANFEDFWARLQTANWRRVFLKLAHGSSASGVVAFSTDGSAMRAETTAEIVRENGEIRLYNSRRLQIYRDGRDVEDLLNALCRERVWIEKWLPKARLNGQNCDVRWLGIGGQARHGIVRLSRSALTNLHLLNTRAPLELLRAQMRESDWEAARQTCEKAFALFSGSLSVGADLVFAPQMRRHAILELNAWGDLLPDVWDAGESVYEAQIREIALEGQNKFWPSN